MSRTLFRELHGIVLLDKPLGLSSNQALQSVRRLLRAAKGGHTGALDPLATGMLPLCFGEATKLAGMLLGSRKAYLAECQLGVTTTTADREGEILLERPIPSLDEATIEAALAQFRGRILQTPPVYSALKQDGEPLYRKARRGETVDVPAREVDIHRLELLSFGGDRLQLLVECGSGTYIRSLAVDLGEALGCGAHLSSLRRSWVEPFQAAPMLSLEQLQQAAEQGDPVLQSLLLPLEAGVAALPPVHLDELQSLAISQGRSVPFGRSASQGACAVFGVQGRLLALGELDDQGVLRVLRGFRAAPPNSPNQAGQPQVLL